ncbi:MAG: nuclear transport factor 2 family protein [Helicobacteraceae bacterium]|jgi:ketosteroid isomerase-like protein|nr:nuclear transport factor 2 family protein [Helicobacteraceae bacterium]
MAANETFVQAYIEAWSTTDDTEREALVVKLYADDATFYAAEAGDEAITVRGHKAIAGNIKHVNVRDIQGHGVRNHLVGFAVNHDMVKASWQMIAPNGAVVANGTSVLLLGEDGRISRDYIFVSKA